MRKREREDEIFKKKYYELLRDYEKILRRNEEKEEKINTLDEENHKNLGRIYFKKRKIEGDISSKQTNDPPPKVWTNEY